MTKFENFETPSDEQLNLFVANFLCWQPTGKDIQIGENYSIWTKDDVFQYINGIPVIVGKENFFNGFGLVAVMEECTNKEQPIDWRLSTFGMDAYKAEIRCHTVPYACKNSNMNIYEAFYGVLYHNFR